MKLLFRVHTFIKVTYSSLSSYSFKYIHFNFIQNKGTRKEGNITEEVVFKVSNEYHLNEFETSLYQEKIIYETIGDHGKQIELTFS